jgi:hypothetical protein
LCPDANGIYDGFFLGNGEINAANVRCAAALLLMDAPSGDLANVAAAMKRAWLLQRHKLRRMRVDEVAQHATDLELVAFTALCRATALLIPDCAAAPTRLAEAVNRLSGAAVIDLRRPAWAKEAHVALTQISDAWYAMGPGDRVVRYVEAAAQVFDACAAIAELPTPRGAAVHPGWCEAGGSQLTVCGLEDMDGLCWGIVRSAYFLVAQARILDCREFALPPAIRTRVVEAVATRLAPSLDPTQLADSVYNHYLSGSSQPGDCALYSRQTGHKPCNVTEALQFVRRKVYKEAFALLRCDAAAAIRETGWPEGTPRALCRRLSQFVREVVLTRTMGMYCTTPGGVGIRIKAYTALEHLEIGWWTGPDIAYPCAVCAGSFWILINSAQQPLYFATDVIDAVCWLLAAISELDGSCDSFMKRIALDQSAT